MIFAQRALLWLTLACAAPMACAEEGAASPAAPATSAALPPLHFAATVPGGAHMQPLRCATPTRTAQTPPRPVEGGTPPAGSDEEELPLTQQQEQELTATAPPLLLLILLVLVVLLLVLLLLVLLLLLLLLLEWLQWA